MSRKARTLCLIVGLALAAAIAGLLLVPGDPLAPYLSQSPNPVPVIVAIGTNKSPVRVFPGHLGCFIILPDGTLWRWGQAGGYQFSRTNLPEQAGTNGDWVQAFAADGNCVAVSGDRSLWSWGVDSTAPLVSSTPVSHWLRAPKRVGREQDWVSATSGGGHAVARKQEGTLWAWGHDSEGQLGNGLGPEETNLVRVLSFRAPHTRTNLVQVGTNDGWTAIGAEGCCTLAIRSDGTLGVGTDCTVAQRPAWRGLPYTRADLS